MNVADAYRECRAIAHKHGANFSVGFRFLPKKKRLAVYAAYAFCRFADDIADEPLETLLPSARGSSFAKSPSSAFGTFSPVPGGEGSQRMTLLDDWQRELDACYAGAPTHPITIALADALQSFAIPKDAFIALIDGCRLDMVKTRYETFEELVHYCDLVASSISDISLSIFGYRSDRALPLGRNLSTDRKSTRLNSSHIL